MLNALPAPVALPVLPGRSPLPAEGEVDPGAPALLTLDGPALAHGELRALVARTAAALPDVREGRLLVRLPLGAEPSAVVLHLATLEAGHVVLPASTGPADGDADVWSPDLRFDGLCLPVDPSQLPHLVATKVEDRRGGATGRDGLAPRHLLHPELALLLSTSGSTGSPKLVRLSHDNLRSNAEGIATALGLRATDRGITSLPLHYCFGLSVLHSHLAIGASVVLIEASVLDEALWRAMDTLAVTDLAVVPHMVELMESTGVLQHPHPALRLITQAGGRLGPERVRRLATLGAAQGWGLAAMYGQTEATARICVHRPSAALGAPDAVGRPIPGTHLRLDTAVREADPALGSGEVVVGGRGVMLGYAEHPDDLALGRMCSEVRTGDLGTLDADGVLRVVGRRSGFVKVLGLRIDLARVESVLETHGLVACVTGDDAGLRVAVEPLPGTSPGDLAGEARRTVARACGLGVGHVRVAVLPLARLSNGKVDRAGCDVLVRGSAPDACAETRRSVDGPATGVRVAEALADVLGRDGIDLERSFVAQGGDSLCHVQASTRLSALLGDLPADWHHRPLAGLVDAAAGTPDDEPGHLRSSGPGGRFQARLGHPVALETSVLLRALAVVMICGTHADLFRLAGGAHTLLVVAGWNAARFGLSAPTRRLRTRAAARLLVGVAAPTMVAALVGLAYGRYGWDNVLLMNWLVGDIAYGSHNELWFVDALVACVLLTTGLVAVPAVARRWERDPWRVAFPLLVVALVPRFLILGLAEGVLRGMMPTVLWLFAGGLAMATATTVARRRWTLAALTLGIVHFFPDDPVRNLTVLAGILLLGLVPTVRVPAHLVPLLATLAAASLHVYLIQFHLLGWVPTPLLGTVAALGAGVLLWRWTRTPLRHLQDRLVPPTDPTPSSGRTSA